MPVVEDLGEVQLDVERSGSGPPLLLIMGMSGLMEHWGEPFLQALRPRFEVIAFDNRGVGRSSRLTTPFTIADLAGDAAALLDALHIDSAHVLGISMGGMVAQELALARPELIDTLTLGCTYCGGPGSALAGEEVMRILGEAMTSGDREQAVRAGWQVNVSADFAADPEASARFMEIGLRRAAPLDTVMAQMRAIATHDTSARLHEIAAPTLVIHGSEDLMLPAVNAPLIAERIPGARLQLIDGVGHLFFWEQPQRAAELVSEHAAAPSA